MLKSQDIETMLRIAMRVATTHSAFANSYCGTAYQYRADHLDVWAIYLSHAFTALSPPSDASSTAGALAFAPINQ
eukprot:m.175414 g.175414  ORF g.175414 m.175414 type:complete len:75 (-) comp18352_c0_seq1:1337-1561(-)